MNKELVNWAKVEIFLKADKKKTWKMQMRIKKIEVRAIIFRVSY